MSALPALKPKQVVKALKKAGFVFIRQKGSHRLFIKGKLVITIPIYNKDLKKGTLRHIIKQSGLELKEFLGLI